ncbi:MAG: hypothetical protein AAB426_15280 [Myxococcota bacterium]
MSRDQHIRRFTLERLLARDLSGEQTHNAQQHLDDCGDCRQLLAQLRAEDEAFTRTVPSAAFRIEHERRIAKRRAPRARWWVLAPAVLAASAAAVLFALAPPDGEAPGVRSKGSGVALEFAVLDGSTLRPGRPGELVAPGARLQLRYDAGDARYMALLGVDRTGTVTVYFPEDSGGLLAPLPGGASGRLPFSLTLDATPGIEHFVAVFAPTAAPLEEIVSALASVAKSPDAALPLHPPLRQASFYIWKTSAPSGSRRGFSAH